MTGPNCRFPWLSAGSAASLSTMPVGRPGSVARAELATRRLSRIRPRAMPWAAIAMPSASAKMETAAVRPATCRVATDSESCDENCPFWPNAAEADADMNGIGDMQDILGANAKIFGADAYCSRFPTPVPSRS